MGTGEFDLGQGLIGGLVRDLLEAAFAGAVVWFSLRPVLCLISSGLLKRGILVPGRLESAPRSLPEGFGGASDAPTLVRNALGFLVLLVGGWLPTRLVNYDYIHKGRRYRGRVAAFYPDEFPCAGEEPNPVLVLIDPGRPSRVSWLCRWVAE